MGCFCQLALPSAQANMALAVTGGAGLGAQASLTANAQLVAQMEAQAGTPGMQMLAAVSAYLSARWLPAPRFAPDPAWLGLELPAPPPMPPQSLSVVLSLVLARQAAMARLGLDPALPAALPRLARIVATLNLRVDALQAMLAAEPPWESLLAIQAQADAVMQAAGSGLLTATGGVNMAVRAGVAVDLSLGEPVGPWRPLLAQVKLLAPVIAIAQSLSINLAQPGALDVLMALVRQLARLLLPPLADQATLLQLVGRLDAAVRLQAIYGVNPRLHAFARVQAAVMARATAAMALLPPGLSLQEGAVVGLPALQPNPSSLLNPATINLAMRLDPALLARMDWQVPPFDQLPLLSVLQPVLALLAAMAGLGLDPVRTSPCGPACDAARAVRALAEA